METKEELEKEECCPLFHSEKWDEKEFEWEGKKFIKASVPAIFHIPFIPVMQRKIVKMLKAAEDANRAEEKKDEVLMLFNDPSPFKSEVYLSVTGDVPEARNTSLSGTFATKVFDGEYKEIPKFIKQMDDYLESKDQKAKAKDYYVHYAYCPECAKAAGHNYMVLFAKVS